MSCDLPLGRIAGEIALRAVALYRAMIFQIRVYTQSRVQFNESLETDYQIYNVAASTGTQI